MLELLNTGRMAAKLGKWRGLAIAFYALIPCFFALLVLKLKDVALMSSAAAAQSGMDTLDWIAIGCLCVAAVLWLWSLWQLYRDQVHGDFYIDAENYKTRGW